MADASNSRSWRQSQEHHNSGGSWDGEGHEGAVATPRQTLCGGKRKRKMAKPNQFQALTMAASHKRKPSHHQLLWDHQQTTPMDSKKARVKLE